MRRFVLLLALTACSSSTAGVEPSPTPSSTGTSTPPPSSTSTPDASTPPSGDAGTDAPMTSSSDPSKDGPYAYTETDPTTKIHLVTPTGAPSPVPTVLIAPGYMIPTTQYLGYAKRLATHGIAAATVAVTQSATSQKGDADDLVAALDTLSLTTAGVMGHSRGGKAAVLAAAADKRFIAVLGLDPVDSVPPGGFCSPENCPDGSDAAKTLTIPSGFLGETLDGTGTFQACAPTADNYATFYASAPSPSFEVTLAGAGHMSFIDDPASCGLVCSICKTPTLAQSEALATAYEWTAAFFLKTLRGDAGQAAFLATADMTK